MLEYIILTSVVLAIIAVIIIIVQVILDRKKASTSKDLVMPAKVCGTDDNKDNINVIVTGIPLAEDKQTSKHNDTVSLKI